MARILGIDIGKSSVRGTVVRSALRSTEVLQYLEQPYQASDDESLRTAIRELIGNITPPPDQVIASLDGREASLRVVELPAGAAKKVSEVLPFELDELVPFEIEDAVIDHQPIDQRDTILRVLATAVPASRVGDRLGELKELGLDPSELAVGAAALDGLRHLLPELKSEKIQLLLMIDLDRTEVCILQNGACMFARTLIGGTEELRAGGRRLGSDLKRTLASYRASGGSAIEEVFVGGEAALYPDSILPWVGELTNVEANVVALPDSPGADPAIRPRFATSTALAGRAVARARRLDLRQGEFAHTKTMSALRQHTRLIAICAACVMMAFAFSTWARYSVLADERDRLQEQLLEVTDDAFGEGTRSPTQARELLAGGRQSADPLPRFTAYDVLDAVSAAVPGDIKHDTRRLTIEVDDVQREGRFELQGTVASIAERDTIAANFEAHECFNEIKRGPTSPGPRNEGLNYRLEATVHCPGDEPIIADERSSRRRRSRRGE